MLAVSAVVIAFLLVGLTVLGAGFATRRRKVADDAPPKNGLLYTGLAIVTVVIGLGIPALVLVNNGNTRDEKAVGGVDLTAAQTTGRELFAKNCSTCHTLQASNATGATGPNLDALKPAAPLVESAILQGRAAGRGNMPAGLLSGNDAKDVASYVAAVAGRGEGVVTESAGGAAGGGAAAGGGQTAAIDAKAIFVQNCGSCHVLKAAGTTGTIGPSLEDLAKDDKVPQITEMIVKPNAEVVKGYQPGLMPQDYGTRLGPKAVAALAAYINQNSAHGG